MKHNWNEIFRALDCDDYNPQGQTFDEGLHCFTIILHFLQLTGHDVKFEDDLLGGLTQENINEKWKEDNRSVIDLCIEYFAPIVKQIDIGKINIGDILIVQVLDLHKRLIPVIYCGNGKVFTMTETGTVRIPLHRCKIISAHRGNNI